MGATKIWQRNDSWIEAGGREVWKAMSHSGVTTLLLYCSAKTHHDNTVVVVEEESKNRDAQQSTGIFVGIFNGKDGERVTSSHFYTGYRWTRNLA